MMLRQIIDSSIQTVDLGSQICDLATQIIDCTQSVDLGVEIPNLCA